MRYLGYLAVVLVLVLTACQAPVEKPNLPTQPHVPAERSAPTEPGVTRIISAASAKVGEPVTVKLYINLQPSETYYLFDENVSTGLRVTDGDVGSDNHIRVVVLQDATSTVETYTVVADAPGAYRFSGEFAIEGNLSIRQIMGDDSLTITP
jgi:hypothetical protein